MRFTDKVILALFLSVITIFSEFSAESLAETLVVPGQYAAIQNAINAAKSGDVILVSPGEYKESIIFLARSGLTLKGVDRETTIINAAGYGRGVGIMVSSSIKISNLTIKGGGAAGQGDDNFGGGIFVDGSIDIEIFDNNIVNNRGVYGGGCALRNSSVYLHNNLIKDNMAISDCLVRGGGVFLYDTGGTISYNEIINNKTYIPISSNPLNCSAPGGGIFHQLSVPNLPRSILIFNNTVSGNETSGYQHYGGGLYIYDSNNSQVRTVKNTFSDNRGLDGGGIAVIESDAIILNNSFQGNQGRWGGGIYGWHMSSLIEGNYFSNNQSSDGGGAVLFDESSQSIFRTNIVRNNTAVNWEEE